MLRKKIDTLKGKDRYETAENYCLLGIISGAFLLAVGIGLSILNTKGVSAISAMAGSLISFSSAAALIAVWLIKEFRGE